MGLAVKNLQAIFERGRIADYLSVYHYVKGGIYALRDGWGFCIECEPMPFAGTNTAKAIESLLTAPRHSDDWYLNIFLYASPYIDELMDEYLKRKEQGKTNINDEVILELFKQRRKFYEEHTKKSFFNEFDFRVRDFKLFVSVIIPYKNKKQTATEIDVKIELEDAIKAKNAYFGVLKSEGLAPRTVLPERYITIMKEILNQEKPTIKNYNPHKEIKEQIIYPSTKIKIKDNGDLLLNENPLRVFSVKSYPNLINLFQFGEIIGSYIDNMKQIPTTFALTMNVKLVDPVKSKEKFQIKSNFITQQADGNPVAKYIPTLHIRYQNYQLALKYFEEDGKVLTPTQLTFWVIGDDEHHLEYLAQFVRNHWSQHKFEIAKENDDTSFTVFLSTLPMQMDSYYDKFLHRFEPIFCHNTSNLAPVFGDYKGNGYPLLTFISRRGQIMSFDPFVSDGNYNIAVAAESGKGKSFFTNELITSVLGEGGKVFVIDVGRSYEKLCEQLGGEFIEFDEKKNIVINPFTNIKTNKNGEIDSSEFELLVPFIGNMCGMNLMASTEEKDPTKRVLASFIEQACREAFRQKQHDTTINDIYEILQKHPDNRAKDIAQALYPFSIHGRYGKWLNGRDNFQYQKDFVVLELDSLEQKEDLKSLILMLMMFRISQDIFFDFKRRKMFIIDEAWQLLRDNISSAFIEKGFRRFRKHNASAMTVTQTINDYFTNETTKALFNNAEWKIFLGQKNEAIEQAKEEKKLVMHEYFFDLLKTVDTVKGRYSEIMIIGSKGIGIGRLLVDRFTYYLYTTDANDKMKIAQIQNELGYSLSEAIKILVERENGTKSRTLLER
ncbi:MAG: conjugal transfer ATP-binding protein TraC [Deferribacteres bacterium]|nr:conjugal transfer ATP-binding protein TraC [Deferribacteres bacterium]